MKRRSSPSPAGPGECARAGVASYHLRAVPHESVAACEQTVFIDLQHVTEITSSGIALFMESTQRINAHGGSLVLIGVRDEVRRVFETARLDKVFRIFPSREAAIAGGPSTARRNAAVNSTHPSHSSR
jgi:anti-anti-sigma factor